MRRLLRFVVFKCWWSWSLADGIFRHLKAFSGVIRRNGRANESSSHPPLLTPLIHHRLCTINKTLFSVRKLLWALLGEYISMLRWVLVISLKLWRLQYGRPAEYRPNHFGCCCCWRPRNEAWIPLMNTKFRCINKMITAISPLKFPYNLLLLRPSSGACAEQVLFLVLYDTVYELCTCLLEALQPCMSDRISGPLPPCHQNWFTPRVMGRNKEMKSQRWIAFVRNGRHDLTFQKSTDTQGYDWSNGILNSKEFWK